VFSHVLCLRCNVDVCCAPAGLLTTVPPLAPRGPLLRGRMVKPKEAELAGDQSDPYVAVPSEPQQESAGKPGNDRPVEETLLPASAPSQHRSAETQQIQIQFRVNANNFYMTRLYLNYIRSDLLCI